MAQQDNSAKPWAYEQWISARGGEVFDMHSEINTKK